MPNRVVKDDDEIELDMDELDDALNDKSADAAEKDDGSVEERKEK